MFVVYCNAAISKFYLTVGPIKFYTLHVLQKYFKVIIMLTADQQSNSNIYLFKSGTKP